MLIFYEYQSNKKYIDFATILEYTTKTLNRSALYRHLNYLISKKAIKIINYRGKILYNWDDIHFDKWLWSQMDGYRIYKELNHD